MKSIARFLLVCFLLLALPFQAFASASMLPSAGQPPCHQQMTAAMDGDHAGQHDKAQCDTCAACHVGAAVASGLPAMPAPPPAGTVSIPFRAGHLPSVDPVLLERPPSIALA